MVEPLTPKPAPNLEELKTMSIYKLRDEVEKAKKENIEAHLKNLAQAVQEKMKERAEATQGSGATEDFDDPEFMALSQLLSDIPEKPSAPALPAAPLPPPTPKAPPATPPPPAAPAEEATKEEEKQEKRPEFDKKQPVKSGAKIAGYYLGYYLSKGFKGLDDFLSGIRAWMRDHIGPNAKELLTGTLIAAIPTVGIFAGISAWLKKRVETTQGIDVPDLALVNETVSRHMNGKKLTANKNKSTDARYRKEIAVWAAGWKIPLDDYIARATAYLPKEKPLTTDDLYAAAKQLNTTKPQPTVTNTAPQYPYAPPWGYGPTPPGYPPPAPPATDPKK